MKINLMQPEYILQNIRIYEKHLKDQKSHVYFMNQISTEYIRAYRSELTKLNSQQEKEVIVKLIDYFKSKQEFRRCAQLDRILKGESLSTNYAF